MRNLNLLLILTLVICTAALANNRNYNVPKADTAVTIDGTLSSGEWDDAIAVIIEYPDIVTPPKVGTLREGSLEPTAEQFSALVYLKWDDDNLYVAFEVTDDYFNETAGRDEPQICFNLLNNPNASYLTEAVVWNLPANGPINANNGLEPTVSTVAGSVTDTGYIVEASIAWSDFASIQSYTPAVNDIHGIGFAMQDHNEAGGRDHFLLDFGDGDLNMSDPTSWNTIMLVNQEDLVLGDWGYMPADFDDSGLVNLSDFAVVMQQWLSCTNPEDPDCIDVR